MREGGAKGIGDDGAFKAELLWRKAICYLLMALEYSLCVGARRAIHLQKAPEENWIDGNLRDEGGEFLILSFIRFSHYSAASNCLFSCCRPSFLS
jgi:hypothetical protein